MTLIDALMGVGGVVLAIAVPLLVFLVMVLLLSWIIKIGVQWGIHSSCEELRSIIREAVLATQPARKKQ